MNKGTFFACLIFPILVGAVSAEGLGNSRQFKMEMKMTSGSGVTSDRSVLVTYYYGDDHMRMKLSMPGVPEAGGHIVHFEKDQVVMYTLVPEMRMYTREVGTEEDYLEEGLGLVFGAPESAGHQCQTDPDMSCEKIGQGELIGRPVIKYRMSETEEEQIFESEVWLDSEYLFPLRMQSSQGAMEAVTLEFDEQADELFDLPADYTEMKTDY